MHGEQTDLDWTKGGLPYYHEHLVRDALGRITQVDQTIAGASHGVLTHTASYWSRRIPFRVESRP